MPRPRRRITLPWSGACVPAQKIRNRSVRGTRLAGRVGHSVTCCGIVKRTASALESVVQTQVMPGFMHKRVAETVRPSCGWCHEAGQSGEEHKGSMHGIALRCILRKSQDPAEDAATWTARVDIEVAIRGHAELLRNGHAI